ncbi:uncharacterized, partial [Tachysurus ichikawai]
MGSSCGSALLFWDVKSSLLFYRAKLERQTRDEDSEAKMLTLDDVQQVLSCHISLSSLTSSSASLQGITRDTAVYSIRHSFRDGMRSCRCDEVEGGEKRRWTTESALY